MTHVPVSVSESGGGSETTLNVPQDGIIIVDPGDDSRTEILVGSVTEGTVGGTGE